jgi:hypothetical protein
LARTVKPGPKTEADAKPRCPGCGNLLKFVAPVEGHAEAMLGTCSRPGCGEWIAIAQLEDGRWLIVGRLARWAWPGAATAQPLDPPRAS